MGWARRRHVGVGVWLYEVEVANLGNESRARTHSMETNPFKRLTLVKKCNLGYNSLDINYSASESRAAFALTKGVNNAPV